MMKRRVARFLVSGDCPACRGKRLRLEPLSITFAGLDITEMSRQPLSRLATLFRPYATGKAKFAADHPETSGSSVCFSRGPASDLTGCLRRPLGAIAWPAEARTVAATASSTPAKDQLPAQRPPIADLDAVPVARWDDLASHPAADGAHHADAVGSRPRVPPPGSRQFDGGRHGPAADHHILGRPLDPGAAERASVWADRSRLHISACTHRSPSPTSGSRWGCPLGSSFSVARRRAWKQEKWRTQRGGFSSWKFGRGIDRHNCSLSACRSGAF